jgi:hypothetical protein
MTDLPDDEPQPGSRAWMEQTAQLDSAMATSLGFEGHMKWAEAMP